MTIIVKEVKKKDDMKYWVMQGMRNFCIEGKGNSIHQWNVIVECLKRPTEQQRRNFIEKYHVYNVIISCVKNGFVLEQF